MANNTFTEGVKPGGLTTGAEVRVLLCYLMNNIKNPVPRSHLEEALLGEELVNYFVLAEALAQLVTQQLVVEDAQGYTLTPRGKLVAGTLADDVPRSVRDTAVRSMIRAQQYAANLSAHRSVIEETENGLVVKCTLEDSGGPLFHMDIYMPDTLSAEAVKERFITAGDEVYKLVLASLTNNRLLAQKSINKMDL